MRQLRQSPQSGDIVISRPSTDAYDHVSIVARGRVARERHDRAIAAAFELALQRRVDLWLSERDGYFVRLAAHREGEHDALSGAHWDVVAALCGFR
jgi:hypothetical protein